MARRAQLQEQPWWLEGGSEICRTCGQPYAYEMERRCADCDTATCCLCAVAKDEGCVVCHDCCGQPASDT